MAAFIPDPTPQHPLAYSAYPARLPGGKGQIPRQVAPSPQRAERTVGGFDSWGGRRGKFPAQRAEGAWSDAETVIRLEGAPLDGVKGTSKYTWDA